MPIGLLTFLGGWKNAIILGVLVCIGLLCAVGYYYWQDYQDLQAIHEKLQHDYDIVVSVNEANEDSLRRMRKQQEQDQAFAKALLARRDKKERVLYDKITELRSIESSDDTVHPAIAVAVGWLREQNESGNSNSVQARSTDSPAQSDGL